MVNYNGEPEDKTPVWFKMMESEPSQEEPECPEAQPRCNDKTAHGNPHRDLSLVDPDVPAKDQTEGVEQGDKSEDDP